MRKLPPRWGAVLTVVTGLGFFLLVFATNTFADRKDLRFVKVLAIIFLVGSAIEAIRYWRRGNKRGG